MIYAATQWSITQNDPGKTKKLLQFFSNSLKDNEALKNADRGRGVSRVEWEGRDGLQRVGLQNGRYEAEPYHDRRQ